MKGSDPAAAAAIGDAVDRLATLRSYRFELSVSGRSVTQLDQDGLVDTGARGTVSRNPQMAVDVEISVRTIESSFDASITVGERLVVVGGTLWEVRPDRSPRPTHVNPEQLGQIGDLFLPEGAAARIVAPFAAAFARVGDETHQGVPAVHYRATKEGLRAYAAAVHLEGAWSADLWIAREGGYLLAVRIDCEPRPARSPGPSAVAPATTPMPVRAFHLSLEISDANDPGIVISAP